MFEHITHAFGKGLVALSLALSVIFGTAQHISEPEQYTPKYVPFLEGDIYPNNSDSQTDSVLGANIQVVADFRTSLASSISSSATTMSLNSFTTRDGTSLVQGAIYGFKIGGSEFVIGTASTSNRIVDMTRGLSVVSGTSSVSSLRKAWGIGTSVEMTDAPILLDHSNKITGAEGFDSPLKYVSTISTTTLALNGQNLASVAYANSLAFGGIPEASESTAGFSQFATGQQVASSTLIGSTGARLSLSTANATYTPPTTGNYIPVTAGGVLNQSVIPGTISKTIDFTGTTTINGVDILGNFGDGSDGDLTIAGGSTTTLSSNKYYNNLTINGALVTNGYMVFVKGVATGTGILTSTTTPKAGGNASGATAGTAGTAYLAGPLRNLSGGVGGTGGNSADGGNGGAAQIGLSGIGSSGVPGGMGGSAEYGSRVGGAPGAGGTSSSTLKFGLIRSTTITPSDFNASGTVAAVSSGAGGGGSGGASLNGGGALGGGGGGGGASGGIVFLAAKTWGGTFTIVSVGAPGGNGANGVAGAGSGGGGGGGGGGSGGVFIGIYRTKTWSGTYTLTGGIGGNAGTGAGAGAGTATAGPTGATGVSYEINDVTLK